MIRFLQRSGNFTKYFMGAILTVICVSMCLYLIPGFMADVNPTGARNGVVATVGGEEIKTAEVTKVAQALLKQQKYPDILLPYMTQQAAQRLIQSAELRYEAQRMGLSVSDQEVVDEMRNGAYRAYFFPDGKFIGQKQYEQFLSDNGTNVDEFEKQVRSDLLTRKLLATVVAGVDVPVSEIEKTYKDQKTKVQFDYAVLNLEDIQKTIKPTDAELQAFYNNNKNRYQNSIPEKRQVHYFVLDDRQAQSKVAVSASDLQQYYGSHQDEYRIPERVKVRHILIKTPTPGPDGKVDQKAVDAARAKAEDVLKQVKSGGNFAQLAEKDSEDPGSAKQGGELNWVVKGQTVPEFEKAAFSLNKGETSGIVQTTYGFHIIQTEEKEAAHLKTLAEVKDQIEPLLRQQKISALLDQMANSAEADAKKQGLDKAAAKAGVQATQSNPVAKAETLPGVGPAPEFMQAVFAASPKDGPQMARLPQGYGVFEVTKIDPPKTPGFDEIKDRVANDFKSERATTLLQQKTQELADRAHAAHDLRKAAKELGATVKTSE